MSATRIPGVRTEYCRAGAGVVREAASLPAAILAGIYGRRGTLSGRIGPLAPTMQEAGVASEAQSR